MPDDPVMVTFLLACGHWRQVQEGDDSVQVGMHIYCPAENDMELVTEQIA